MGNIIYIVQSIKMNNENNNRLDRIRKLDNQIQYNKVEVNNIRNSDQQLKNTKGNINYKKMKIK